MDHKITKEEIERVKNIKGDVRGAVFKTDKDFILKEGGEEKLKEVEERISSFGHSLKYNEVGEMEFYPFTLRVFSIIAIKEVFDFDESQIKEMGKKAPKVSFVIKFFTKYFLSPEKTLSKIEEIWAKHSTTGKVKAKEINEKEGFAIFSFSENEFHPLYCKYLSGYLEGAISMALQKNVIVEELSCGYSNSGIHEFKAKWEN